MDGDGDLDLLAANFSGNNVSILINQPPPPQVHIVGDSVLCSGGQSQLTARGPLPIVAYRWSTGATTASITVAQPGTYSVSVTFNEGTISTDQHVVTVITPTMRITGDSVVCGGQAAALVAVSPGARSYRWSNGATTAGISVTQSGTYTVTASFGTGCSVTARVVVRVPALLITGNAVLCNTAGATTVLTAISTPGANIRWNTGATTAALSVTQAGTYTATATFPNGCTLTTSQVVSAAAAIPTFSLGADTTLCEGSALILRAPASQPGLTYRWSDGTTASTLLVTQSGTYSLQLIGNCDSRTISRRVDYQNCMLIPNVVTANNDGQNDQFKIQGLAGGIWALQVYDRWGRQVYNTSAYQNNWGDQAAAGMYYYLLRRNDNGTNYKGWVEVLR